MAARFWVGGTGTWDNSTTTHWSATSNGAGGQSVPGSSDTVTFDGSSGGGTVTPNYNMTVVSITMGAFTGTLDFSTNNNSPTMGTFSLTGSGTRTLNMGTGTWTLTGNAATIWAAGTQTGLTLAIGNPIVCNYSGATGTRTIDHGTSATSFPNFNITAGTDIISITTSITIGALNFTGFTGSLAATSFSIAGGITFGSGMTVTSGNNTFTFRGQTGTNAYVITSNSVQVNRNFKIDNFDFTGCTWSLGDNLDMTGAGLRIFTLTKGSLSLNNKNVSSGGFSSSNSNIRALTLGSGTWTLVADDNDLLNFVWLLTTSTNMTLTPNSSTIKLTKVSANAQTLAGGSLIYNNLWFARTTASGANQVTGSNTFNDIKDDGSVAHSLKFTAGATQTITTFTVIGTIGNLISIDSVSGTSTHALVKSGSGYINCNYLSIQHSIVTPSATWYAGTNSTDNNSVATAGSGWTFTASPPTTMTMNTLSMSLSFPTPNFYYSGWTQGTKHTSSWIDETKDPGTWTNPIKH